MSDEKSKQVGLCAMFGGNLTFNHHVQEWSIFRSRFIQYCTANGISDDNDKSGVRRRALLLTALLEDTYRIARDLVFPGELENIEYKNLLEKLNSHFLGKKCTFAERYSFYKAEQRPGEELTDWAARVRSLAQFCGFKAELETALRDRFVLGLEDRKEKEKLFAESIDTLTFSRALELAQSVRCARLALHSTVGVTEMQPQPVFAMQRNRNSSDNSISSGMKLVSQNTPRVSQCCAVCGYKNHTKEKCRFANYSCKKCNVKGHLKRMCKTNLSSNNFVSAEDNVEEGIYNLFNLQNPVKDEPIKRNVCIDGNFVLCEIDCGSAVSVLPTIIYTQLFKGSKHILHPCHNVFNFYTGVKIVPDGCVTLPVTYANTTKPLVFYVLSTSEKRLPLLGRDFMRLYNLHLCSKLNCNNLGQVDTDGDFLVKKYSKLFSDELGTFNKYKINLKIKSDAQLKFFKPRSVPLALKPKIEEELNRLLDLGILEKIDHSDVATPIVPVLRPDGNVRICGDFSVTLNKVLYLDNYTIPRIEDLFSKLHGGVEFSKLDLSRAYLQLELDESKKWTCINTHQGLYRYNRLVFGLANAPFIFQRTMEQLLTGIEGVCIYLDDILITAPDRMKHLQRLELVLSKLQEAGLRLKRDKCELFKSSVEYLGYVIDKDGLHKSNKKVEAIVNCKPPKNVTELKSFLGMVNYYRCFVPNTSSVISPLNNLLKKDTKWVWGKYENDAFNKIKAELVSESVLAHYDPELCTIVTCDAGPYGLGAVLAQRQRDGSERVVAYASRALNKAEINYAQIQKEATAIIFAVRKFNHYLYGCTTPFILRTDHKPLLAIFGNKKGVPILAANRLQRYALFLSAYNFNIEYVKGENNVADFLSRSVEEHSFEESEFIDRSLYINFIGETVLPPITIDSIRSETIRDRVLQRVIQYINGKWPSKMENLELRPYFLCRNELSLESGCILRGHKIIIPTAFRERLLDELHDSHFGIVKTKSEARSRMWWPNIDKHIEEKIGNCNICNTLRSNPPHAPLAPWPYPERAWERVHLDMFMFSGVQFLIAVDAHSKWVECFIMQKTDSETVIGRLCEMFSRYGLVRTLVTDNATNFCSNVFETFCMSNGISHITSAPYHPASNGQAENSVKIIKNCLKAMNYTTDKKVMNSKLNKILFNYRNSIHSATGFSPAQLMLGRPLRCRLDLLRLESVHSTTLSPFSSAAKNNVLTAQKTQCKQYDGKRKLHLKVGHNVLVKIYFNNGNKHTWKRGIIKSCIGSRMFMVYIPELKVNVKKHIDQLLLFRGNTSLTDSDNGSCIGDDTTENSNRLTETETGSASPTPHLRRHSTEQVQGSSISDTPASNVVVEERGTAPDDAFLDADPADLPDNNLECNDNLNSNVQLPQRPQPQSRYPIRSTRRLNPNYKS